VPCATIRKDDDKERSMSHIRAAAAVGVLAALLGVRPGEGAPQAKDEKAWTEVFGEELSDLVSTGKNPYFSLEPGHVLVLEDPKDKEVLTITVLAETKKVDGVETRIVEERETVDGKLKEVSRNFFAISKRTNNVYYFGEEVDDYKDGKIVGHGGAWLSGEKGARWGLLMPSVPLVGARHYQEIAPGIAMDRAEIVSITEILEVPAGAFKNVLKVEETTPLEPGKAYKYYAPGVGLLRDGGLRLVRHGAAAK
jgi:hypothetical protein